MGSTMVFRAVTPHVIHDQGKRFVARVAATVIVFVVFLSHAPYHTGGRGLFLCHKGAV